MEKKKKQGENSRRRRNKVSEFLERLKYSFRPSINNFGILNIQQRRNLRIDQSNKQAKQEGKHSLAPMDYAVDMSCEMKVNRNCDLCRQKVSEIMHNLTAVYSVDFVGEGNVIKLKARANPNLILAIIQRYGDHGKITNFHLDGQLFTALPRGGFSSPSGFYHPSTAAGNYQYPPQYFAGNYGYPMSNPPPPYFAGNCGNPMSIPPQKQTEAPAGIYKYHTAPPSFTHTPPPPRPLHSYAYVEPPYWPTSSSSGGNCVIM